MTKTTEANACLSQPSLLGLRPSFGFGDRLGLATPGHIAACKLGRLAPIFAQQSARELSRTQRTAAEVLRAAQEGIARAGGWNGPWGADGDHLKTKEDVEHYAAAGFTFFTIDPSAYVQNTADTLRGDNLEAAVADVARSGAFESAAQIRQLYLGRKIELPGIGALEFAAPETLHRAVVKYGKAIAYVEKMAGWITQARGTQGAEIEASVDETDTPTTPLEHLFIGLELKRRGVKVVSLAPRFIGEFEKGVDYKGDLERFEADLRQHVVVAKYCGPYKISVHSGSDKFSIYPIVGRVCGDLLHVKTAGTNYLEALRVVARQAPNLFLEIVEFAHTRFDADRASYLISAQLARLSRPAALTAQERERVYLNESDGRQVLHVTYGSVLAQGRSPNGRAFKAQILETLHQHEALHQQVLVEHLGKHIRLLSAG